MGPRGVDGGEASPSSKKLIIGNPEFWLGFCLNFLDEFLKDFAGIFLRFGLWLGVARSPFLDRFYLYRFLYYNNSILNNFDAVFAPLGVGGGVWVVVIGDSAGLVPNAATSDHDTCVFSPSFLNGFQLYFVGTFTGRSFMVRSC